jgi:hypothetical protein
MPEHGDLGWVIVLDASTASGDKPGKTARAGPFQRVVYVLVRVGFDLYETIRGV